MNNSPKILYVDDEVINLKLFEINLEMHYNIFTAESGEEGLEVLKANPDIEVVISDMKMPMMNGIEFITIAKEHHPKTKFFILTGFEITEEIKEALDSKLIIKYFKKPFNANDIHKTMSGYFNTN